ncbi:hypothetical protein BO70DRAFT_383319 [Aspergillus heteromorphus CBS 117.55]|uniref:Uncharacterized protein n=1 Tax=Aspergillus heteromorphus CBS 117.55 TaxID=1448321 RepID=A0A317UXQ1_9EURO|nr:uncharacterized protein BO70DRAFT_383319 [Aspergillus heteromorphus CBS 117.55]PWY65297.1 hypothetical protein BO70DRAFT_383319 [Aspergillus heteromorphus CBS 117.55]
MATFPQTGLICRSFFTDLQLIRSQGGEKFRTKTPFKRQLEHGQPEDERCVRVPHPDVAVEYQARQRDVLAGRTGMMEVGEEGRRGEIDDGWAEDFDYEKYGIEVAF